MELYLNCLPDDTVDISAFDAADADIQLNAVSDVDAVLCHS
jgi:hypothetical protein